MNYSEQMKGEKNQTIEIISAAHCVKLQSMSQCSLAGRNAAALSSFNIWHSAWLGLGTIVKIFTQCVHYVGS